MEDANKLCCYDKKNINLIKVWIFLCSMNDPSYSIVGYCNVIITNCEKNTSADLNVFIFILCQIC